jgi:hypothetical protein
MSAKSPPIPKEQRSFHGRSITPANAPHDRRAEKTGLQSGQPGDQDANLKSQGRFGNLRQNTRNQGYQQDR